MDEIDKGILEAQEHYLRGAEATNKTFSSIGGRQLRNGDPEVINQYKKNLKKIENHSNEVSKKLENLQKTPAGKKTKSK